jgi:hypothetical protein
MNRFISDKYEVCEEAVSGVILVLWGVAMKLAKDWLVKESSKQDEVPKSE